jgi:hypothetical protein
MKHTISQPQDFANDNFEVNENTSKHASKNFRRRGIENATAQAVLIHGDLFSYRGKGVTLVQISKKKILALGGKTPEGIQTDRLKNLCLLVSNDNTIVTAIRPRKGRYKVGRSVEG